MKSKVLLGAVCAAIAAMVAPVAAQAADSIDITYFTIAETDRDANALGFGTVNNEVQNTLGPDGLPVLNTAAYGCSTNCFTLAAPTDVTAGGEITYWSPALNNGGAGGTSDVTQTLTTTTSLPFSVPSNFFPPNGTGSSDYNGFQAAELSGTISVPETEQISFNIGADDMAFAYLDGQIVCDLGGVHGSTAGTCATPLRHQRRLALAERVFRRHQQLAGWPHLWHQHSGRDRGTGCAQCS
jgi:hypothetical protein